MSPVLGGFLKAAGGLEACRRRRPWLHIGQCDGLTLLRAGAGVASEILSPSCSLCPLLTCQGCGADFQRELWWPDGHTSSYLYGSMQDRRPRAKPPFGRHLPCLARFPPLHSPAEISFSLTPPHFPLLAPKTFFKKALQSECLGLPIVLSWSPTAFLWKLFFKERSCEREF